MFLSVAPRRSRFSDPNGLQTDDSSFKLESYSRWHCQLLFLKSTVNKEKQQNPVKIEIPLSKSKYWENVEHFSATVAQVDNKEILTD